MLPPSLACKDEGVLMVRERERERKGKFDLLRKKCMQLWLDICGYGNIGVCMCTGVDVL